MKNKRKLLGYCFVLIVATTLAGTWFSRWVPGPSPVINPNPEPRQKLHLTRSRLQWDSQLKRYRRFETAGEVGWIEPLTASRVYNKPAVRSKAQDISANLRMVVFGYQLCDPKDKIPECDPGLPAERPRW